MPHRRSLLAALAIPSAAAAQGVRGVRLVAPYPPGGGIDVVARLIAGPMGEALAQPVIVENRPGAGGSIGAAAVAAAAPDGQTILLDALGHIINPLLIRDLSFDYAAAFAPVCLVVTQPLMIVGNPRLPSRDLGALLARTREAGSDLSFGSSGNGTGPHIAAETLLLQAGGRAVHVPYRGAAPALQDVMGGSLAFAVVTAGSAVALAREGRVIPLAVTGPERMAALPDVPTVAEAALPDFVFQEWNGIFAPAGTPEPVIIRLHQAARHALAQASVQERLAAIGATPIGADPASFTAFLTHQREVIAATVLAAGITG